MQLRSMKACYEGKCGYCYKKISIGDEIVWIESKKMAFCNQCASLPLEILLQAKIQLKYDSECSYCHKHLNKGELALWIPDKRKVLCNECCNLPEELKNKVIIRNTSIDFCDCCSRRILAGELKELRPYGSYKRSYCLNCSQLSDEQVMENPCKHKKIKIHSSSQRTQHGGSYYPGYKEGYCIRCGKKFNSREIDSLHDILVFRTSVRYGPRGGFSSSDFSYYYQS